MAYSRKAFFVNLAGSASIAAAQAAITAAIATVIAGGFFPEAISVAPGVPLSNGSRNDCVVLQSNLGAFRDWLGVTLAAVNLIPLNGAASIAAIQALIDADGTTMDGTATPKARNSVMLRLAIGGQQTDVLAIIYTNGAPAVS